MDVSAYRRLVLADAPTYYWPCQEPSGSALRDFGSGAKDLTIGNGAVSANGPNGHRCFAGTSAMNAAVSPGSPDAAANSTGFTLEAWFATTTAQVNTAIISNWEGGNGALIYSTSGSILRMYHNGSFTTLGTLIADGTWHHYATTWDGATQRGYIDGVETASAARTGGLGSAVRLSVGYYAFDGGTTWPNAAIAHAAWHVNSAVPAEALASRVSLMRRMKVSF